MGRFLFRRFVSIIPTMFVIVTLSFFMMRAAPGGPFSREREIPANILQNILKKYHMDEPLPKQYLRFLGDVLHGDLGPSFKVKDFTVNELIAQSLPHSLTLGLTALAFAFFAGVAVGIVSALKQNTAADYAAMSVAVTGISVPLFVAGPILMLIFAIGLKILPTSGWINDSYGMAAMVLPAFTLSMPYFAYIARLSRASIIEVLRSDYIRTAKAKGLSMPVIVVKHVLKGALLPVVSYLGPACAGIVTGSVVVESIFAVPGLGTYFVRSAINRDYTLIMGTVIVYSAILIVMNFIVDIIYGLLDPRISYK
jgi:oligopeptide transport system permease protein